MWLDSARGHPVTGRWSLLGFDPWLRFTAWGDRVEVSTTSATRVVREHPLEALRTLLRRYAAPPDHPFGRAIGLLGFLSYDLNRWIERLPAPQPSTGTWPDMQWFGMARAILVDHVDARSWLMSVADPHLSPKLATREARERLEELEAWASAPTARMEALTEGADSTAGGLEPTSSKVDFCAMVERALAYIQAGDIFQANLSQRFTAPWEGPAWPLYQALRRVNPSPFACWFSSPERTVVSCSPERLVRVQEGRIDTRPIAGTRPRGETAWAEALNELDLLLSEKERAEHLMLVDLARNDLGRVARTGSVRVNEFMGLEAYSHVLHLVSDVAAVLRPGTDAVDVIRAIFPGGTITGCPKVRSMQIIRELEPVARGLYTGSLGYLGFDGTLDLNIAIRTMVLQAGRLSFHVGAGIVADSDPGREYDETLAKAAALKQALQVTRELKACHADAR